MELSTRLILREISQKEDLEITTDAENLLRAVLQNKAKEIIKEASETRSSKSNKLITQEDVLKCISNKEKN